MLKGDAAFDRAYHTARGRQEGGWENAYIYCSTVPKTAETTNERLPEKLKRARTHGKAMYMMKNTVKYRMCP